MHARAWGGVRVGPSRVRVGLGEKECMRQCMREGGVRRLDMGSL